MTSEQVVMDNSKLIYKIATKFYGVPKEDLYQAGMAGLLKAYQQYDPNSKAKFSTFAYKYIFGEMFLIANKKIIKVNRDILKMYKHIEKTRYMYAQELGHIPNNFELSCFLNMPVETIDFVCASSNEIVSMDNDSDSERSMYETIPSLDYINPDDRLMLYESLNMLPEEERKVIIERYFKDETQDKIASRMNTSQVRVSRLEKRGLIRMRKLMETH